ncbi:MAG: MFS transporter [Alphaproteobacteria bacterium]|nr:MFS transporter [Alphaproteobacteria bacterium]
MHFPQLRGSISPEARTALFYFIAYGMPGALGAYFGIWLTDRGLSAGEIGWINSAPIFLSLLLNLSVGRLADRAGDWRSAIVIGAFVSLLLTGGLFFASGFWSMLAVFTLMILPFALVMPVLDAATMRLTRRNGSNFALVRAFGTVGYVTFLFGAALVVGMFGAGAYVPLVFAIALARAIVSLVLPRFRARADAPPPVVAAVPAPMAEAAPPAIAPATHLAPTSRLADVLKPWFVAPIVAFALMQGLHFILGAFSGLIWRDNGIDETLVGPLLALGSIAEIFAMLSFRRFAARFTARHLMLFAVLVSAIRWGGMALNPPLWVLALLQLTHAATFAIAYLGLLNFIANWTSEDIAAEAQSFAMVVQTGVIVVSLSSFGYLVDLFGNLAFASGVVTSLLAAACLVWSLNLKPAADTDPPENATG